MVLRCGMLPQDSQANIPGRVVTLNQQDASLLMALGHVRPEDEQAWTPGKLLSGSISKSEPKKMFDIEPAPKNFATDGGFKRER